MGAALPKPRRGVLSADPIPAFLPNALIMIPSAETVGR